MEMAKFDSPYRVPADQAVYISSTAVRGDGRNFAYHPENVPQQITVRYSTWFDHHYAPPSLSTSFVSDVSPYTYVLPSLNVRSTQPNLKQT